MNRNVIIKRSVDVAMYILFLLLMGQCVLRGVVHEWMGISVGILFLVHNALNYKWYRTLFKGEYNAIRTVQLVVNVLLLLAMLICMTGGVLISQHIFAVHNGNAIEFGRHLHLVATAWGFILMSVHLGLHWSIFSAIAKKIQADEKEKKVIHIICCVLVAFLCAYGLYQFADRRFWEELFHLIDYQKEYDYSKTLLPYFAQSAALSVPFITMAYYVKKFLLSRNGTIRISERERRSNRK